MQVAETTNVGSAHVYSSIRKSITRQPGVYVVYGLLVAVAVWAGIDSSAFRNATNLIDIPQAAILLALAGLGQTMVIVSGGIDLSVGSVAKLSALLAAIIMNGHNSMIIPALLACMALGAAVGAGNGLLISKLNLAPFIVTFGMYYIIRGTALTVTTAPIGQAAPAFVDLYLKSFFGIPVDVYLLAAVFAAGWFVLTRTPFGRHVYGIGGDAASARLSGVHVVRVRVLTYVICAMLAALAGLWDLSRMGVGDPLIAEGLELQSITAVALGGTSLFGGRGSLLGTLGGVLVITAISNAINLMQVNTFFQQLILGVTMLVALSLYKQQ